MDWHYETPGIRYGRYGLIIVAGVAATGLIFYGHRNDRLRMIVCLILLIAALFMLWKLTNGVIY